MHIGGASLKEAGFPRRHGCTIMTAILFLPAFAGQWWLGRNAHEDERSLHAAPALLPDHIVGAGRATLAGLDTRYERTDWRPASPSDKHGQDLEDPADDR